MWPINGGKNGSWTFSQSGSGDAVSIGKPTNDDGFLDITDSVRQDPKGKARMSNYDLTPAD